MTLESELVEWARSRPSWQRHVLHRLCRRESFDDEAITAIADALIVGRDFGQADLAEADIPGAPVASEPVAVLTMRNVEGVNALASGQELSFGQSGLTIVYGDNACGKSGYARLLKAAAGGRLVDDILGNVFASGPAADQSAIVDYRVADDTPQEWKWPGPPSPALQQVHFYDEASGDDYLDKESEITYRPSALVLLDQLIQVCDAVRAALEGRLGELNAQRASLPAVPTGSSAALFLASMTGATTGAEIDAACATDAQASATLGQLLTQEARLRASNPEQERDRLLRLADDLEFVARHCDDLARKVNADAIAQLVDQRQQAIDLRGAATIASSRSFESEPLNGVGSGTWRALWQAAREFSQIEAYREHRFPNTDPGSRCVLCHQELSEEAAARQRRFDECMTDTTERDAAAAESRLKVAEDALRSSVSESVPLSAALGRVRDAEAGLASQIEEWLTSATRVASQALERLGDLAAEMPVLAADPPVEQVRARANEVTTAANELDARSFAGELSAVSHAVAELQGKIALNEHRQQLQAEVIRLSSVSEIEQAKRATDTGAITRKSSELTRDYVTREVRDQFTRESERVRLRRITLDDAGAVKGKLKHRPALLGAARRAAVSKVLSEGEQTALGLSGFFTEVVFDDSRSAVVLDDPVTSLDHGRRSLVARRLVELAADRQVIVFTHEVTFVGDLVRHASEGNLEVTERWIQRSGDILGICADKHPWKAKDVAARIDSLTKDLAAIKRDRHELDQEQYEERSASWAGKLSETWERAINLEIVNEVVDRGTSQVRPMKFRILAAITQEDDAEFQAGYGRCSEWARRHDKDPGINFVAPEPDDMEQELERVRTWFKRIKSYRS